MHSCCIVNGAAWWCAVENVSINLNRIGHIVVLTGKFVLVVVV